MELKPGFKQTEVGVIPESWEVIPLGAISETSSGTTPSRALQDRYYNNGSIAWVKTLDLNNKDIIATDENVTEVALSETSLRVYPIGTVLIAMYGGFKQIGRTGLLRRPAAVNQAITAIRPNVSKLASSYLLYNLNYRVNYWRYVASSSRKDPNITGKDIREFPIACPKPVEQETIAEALIDADALVESLEQLIAKKRHLKQGAIQELLTGKTRLPGFSDAWEERALGQMGKCHRGVSYNPSVNLSPFDTESTVRLLRANNVQESKIILTDMQYVSSCRVSDIQRLRPNDILICMANGSRDLVGKAGRFSTGGGFEYTFGAFMACFRPNGQSADPDYVFDLFQTEKYRAHIAILLAGSSINNLTPGSVEALSISIPSDKTEQAAIAGIVSDMDAEIDALETQLVKARSIKQGMMQELLIGRIRLI